MARYQVNAAVTVDAWAYVKADTPEDALEQARSLTARDFELGDAFAEFDVNVESVELDV